MLLSIIQKNSEFIIYAGVLIPLVIVIHKTDNRFNYLEIALWGFALWMLLHLLGGLASWHGIRLYDHMLINLVGEPYLILKYDQFVHWYCYVVITMLMASIVQHITKENAHRGTFAVIVVLAGSAVGAINEIIEFLPVVLFNSPGPGGYTNTVLDIIANFLGAIVGTWLYLRLRKR